MGISITVRPAVNSAHARSVIPQGHVFYGMAKQRTGKTTGSDNYFSQTQERVSTEFETQLSAAGKTAKLAQAAHYPKTLFFLTQLEMQESEAVTGSTSPFVYKNVVVEALKEVGISVTPDKPQTIVGRNQQRHQATEYTFEKETGSRTQKAVLFKTLDNHPSYVVAGNTTNKDKISLEDLRAVKRAILENWVFQWHPFPLIKNLVLSLGQ